MAGAGARGRVSRISGNAPRDPDPDAPRLRDACDARPHPEVRVTEISQPTIEAVIKFLESKWKGSTCPLCKTGNWLIQNHVYELRRFFFGNLNLNEGPIVPVVTVSCNNCGNTILVNAITAGAIPPAPKQDETSAEAAAVKS